MTCASTASTVAVLRRSRRQQPIAASNIADAHMKGSWPSRSASTRAGFTSAAADHQPLRSSGNAQNVIPTMPAQPTAKDTPTDHSCSNGQRTTANIHGMNP